MAAGRLTRALEQAGHVLFRVRNLAFPAVLGAVVSCFPPPEGAWGRYAALQIGIGLALIAAGQGIRVLTIGLQYIKRGGKNRRVFAHGLVTGGVFAHSRNPMYLGNLMLVAGYMALLGNPVGAVAGGAFFLFAYAAIIAAEEDYLAGRFGDAYAAYCRSVPRMLPRIRGLTARLRAAPFDSFDARKVISKEHGTLFMTLLLTAGLLAYRTLRVEGADGLRARLPVLIAVVGAGTAAYVAARIAKKKTTWLRRPVPDGG